MKWRDNCTPDLPLVFEGPRGQGSNQRGKERQRGEFAGMRVTQSDLDICRLHWDKQAAFDAYRDAWLRSRAMKHRRSVLFMRRLRAPRPA